MWIDDQHSNDTSYAKRNEAFRSCTHAHSGNLRLVWMCYAHHFLHLLQRWIKAALNHWNLAWQWMVDLCTPLPTIICFLSVTLFILSRFFLRWFAFRMWMFEWWCIVVVVFSSFQFCLPSLSVVSFYARAEEGKKMKIWQSLHCLVWFAFFLFDLLWCKLGVLWFLSTKTVVAISVAKRHTHTAN